MKKVLCLMLALVLVLGVFAGCGPTEPDEENKDPNKGATSYEIALITDKGNIDDKSFNQGAWEGVVAYAMENMITHKYYRPAEATNEEYLAAIDLAVLGGAKVIVTPGFLFETPIFNAQTKYPNINFILLDGAPNNGVYDATRVERTDKNVAAVFYAEEEVGYLAGYAAAKDGFKSLGFMGGMEVPAVSAFGLGYLQGIEAAATEMGVADGSIKVQYHFTGDFEESTRNKSTALSMISSGAEIIFACGGSVGKSVFAACVEQGKKSIGVDVDQKADSTTVVTSATKGLAASVVEVLTAYYKGTFSEFGGKSTYFAAKNGGVGLPDDFSRFTTFTKADYDKVFAKLVDGSVKPLRALDSPKTAADYVNGLGLKKISLTYIK